MIVKKFICFVENIFYDFNFLTVLFIKNLIKFLILFKRFFSAEEFVVLSVCKHFNRN